MNVLIYGAGAIGSFTGYLLSDPKGQNANAVENVALLGRKGHIQKIREEGLDIIFPDKHENIIFKHCFSGLEELIISRFHPHIVIICVKTYSLSQVCREIKESGVLNDVLKDAKFILLLNGMGNKETFDLDKGSVFEGITSMGVKFSADGLIELKGAGKAIFEHGIDPRIKQFMKERYEEKGFQIEFSKDFGVHQWNKLFVNSVINPITALTRKENGIVLSKHLSGTAQKIIQECLSVASKEGFEFDEANVLEGVLSVASKTSRNTSSMLQDLIKGKRTEIDSINGYILKLAKKHSVPVPVNDALYSLVKSSEGSAVLKS